MKNKLLMIILYSTFFVSCIPQYIVSPKSPMVRVNESKRLPIRSFTIEDKTSKDIDSREEKRLSTCFQDYISLNNTITPYRESNDLSIDVQISPKKKIYRTWILDAGMIYPCPGYFPLTPWWGYTKIDIDINVTTSVKSETFSFSESTKFLIWSYPYYRAGKILTEKFRTTYEKLFLQIMKHEFPYPSYLFEPNYFIESKFQCNDVDSITYFDTFYETGNTEHRILCLKLEIAEADKGKPIDISKIKIEHNGSYYEIIGLGRIFDFENSMYELDYVIDSKPLKSADLINNRYFYSNTKTNGEYLLKNESNSTFLTVNEIPCSLVLFFSVPLTENKFSLLNLFENSIKIKL